MYLKTKGSAISAKIRIYFLSEDFEAKQYSPSQETNLCLLRGENQIPLCQTPKLSVSPLSERLLSNYLYKGTPLFSTTFISQRRNGYSFNNDQASGHPPLLYSFSAQSSFVQILSQILCLSLIGDSIEEWQRKGEIKEWGAQPFLSPH